jgi:flagellar basal-body rod modification protein FlgD
MDSTITNIDGLRRVEQKPEAAQGSNKLGKDEFLKLMMAQLGQQDPTAPVDSQAFVAQLAQFASLELAQNANTSLESLLIAQTASNQTALTTFVGKDVVFRTDNITLEAGRGASGMAQLGANAESVTAVITDAQGKTVRTLQLGRQSAGPLDIAWDGRDDRGTVLPAGTYKLRVTAKDAQGGTVGVEQRGTGHVNGVAFENGVPQLRIGNISVSVADVVEIKERTGP